MSRVYNFSAGPATLPEPVLAQAAAEMLDWEGTGMSVMEMSHRGRHFEAIAAEAEQDLRQLLAVPPGYRVLFLQGGATLQFSAIPLNLLPAGGEADYLVTGEWSAKALEEAARYGRVRQAASGQESGFTRIPERSTWRLSPTPAFFHYCSNETIHGVEFHWIPDVGTVPLVADMSSHILSAPLDVSRFGLIYAGAQKNIGPAGLVIVIVREDLLGRARPECPSLLDYERQAKARSMPNTPATYSIYIAGLVFKWLLAQGGLAEMARRNAQKACLLYEAIDGSGFYTNPVRPEDRSLMNVPFRLPEPALDKPFLDGAAARGLVELKGHRSVGGMRASIYNAMPLEGVQHLVAYLREFQARHG